MQRTIERKKIARGTSLAQAYPDIAAQWNYELNDDTPYDISCGVHKKRWFTCSNGHNYDAMLSDRTNGKGCGYCAGKRIGYGNDLASNYPHLVKEWHIDNNKLPNEFMPKSNKKAKWICKNKHIWTAEISSRTDKKNNCPKCHNKGTSQPEIKLRKLLNGKIKKIAGFDVDAVVDNWVIQYDGARFHTNHYQMDVRRTNAIIDKGYKVIRVRVQENRNPLKDIPNAINIHFDIKDEIKLNMQELADKINNIIKQ